MSEGSRHELYKNHSEIIDTLVHFLSDPLVPDPEPILNVLGEVFIIDEVSCSRYVQTPSFKLISKLQKVLCYGNSAIKQITLWLICNLLNNSPADLQCIADSSIIANIVHSCRDLVQVVRKEAMFCLANLLKHFERQPQRIVQLTLDFEIETLLHKSLNESSSEIVFLALNCYKSLFTADQTFIDNFERMDGLTTLENL